MKIVICMPTYNEAENLPNIIPAIFEVLPEVHVLVLDDNSPDGTGQIADALAAEEDKDRLGEELGDLLFAVANLARHLKLDPEDALRLIERERVTAWAALGSAGPRTARHPKLRDYDTSSLQSISFGGAPTSPATSVTTRARSRRM